jgi:hypothetical protein
VQEFDYITDFLRRHKALDKWEKTLRQRAKLRRALLEACPHSYSGDALNQHLAATHRTAPVDAIERGMRRFLRVDPDSVREALTAGILLWVDGAVYPNYALIRHWTERNGAWQLAQHLSGIAFSEDVIYAPGHPRRKGPVTVEDSEEAAPVGEEPEEQQKEEEQEEEKDLPRSSPPRRRCAPVRAASKRSPVVVKSEEYEGEDEEDDEDTDEDEEEYKGKGKRCVFARKMKIEWIGPEDASAAVKSEASESDEEEDRTIYTASETDDGSAPDLSDMDMDMDVDEGADEPLTIGADMGSEVRFEGDSDGDLLRDLDFPGYQLLMDFPCLAKSESSELGLDPIEALAKALSEPGCGEDSMPFPTFARGFSLESLGDSFHLSRSVSISWEL